MTLFCTACCLDFILVFSIGVSRCFLPFSYVLVLPSSPSLVSFFLFSISSMGVLWAFQVCGLISFTIWEEYLAIIFSNISSLLSLFLVWNFSCSYFRLFDTVPQFLDLLAFFFFFFVSNFLFLTDLYLCYYIFISGISISYFLSFHCYVKVFYMFLYVIHLLC